MKTFLFALALVVALMVGGIGGYAIAVYLPSKNAVPANEFVLPASREIVYRIPVSQCTEISASYRLPEGSKVSNSRICPDTAVVSTHVAHTGDFLYLSAQNQSHPDNRNHFACEIVADGMILAQVEAVGFGEIATCEATVP